MDDPNNYRPISVITTVAKIFEKCVCDQLSEYLNAGEQPTKPLSIWISIVTQFSYCAG